MSLAERVDFIDPDPQHVGLRFGPKKTRYELEVKRRAIVPMNDAVLQAVMEAHSVRPISHVIERGGQRIYNVKKAYQAASKRCDFRVTLYMLRHTGAVSNDPENTLVTPPATCGAWPMVSNVSLRTTMKVQT